MNYLGKNSLIAFLVIAPLLIALLFFNAPLNLLVPFYMLYSFVAFVNMSLYTEEGRQRYLFTASLLPLVGLLLLSGAVPILSLICFLISFFHLGRIIDNYVSTYAQLQRHRGWQIFSYRMPLALPTLTQEGRRWYRFSTNDFEPIELEAKSFVLLVHYEHEGELYQKELPYTWFSEQYDPNAILDNYGKELGGRIILMAYPPDKPEALEMMPSDREKEELLAYRIYNEKRLFPYMAGGFVWGIFLWQFYPYGYLMH